MKRVCSVFNFYAQLTFCLCLMWLSDYLLIVCPCNCKAVVVYLDSLAVSIPTQADVSSANQDTITKFIDYVIYNMLISLRSMKRVHYA